MKFSCVKSELVSAVQTAGRFVATKASTPILAGMRLTAGDGVVEISATDYEAGTVLHVKADVEEQGEVVVLGRIFCDTVRVMPGDKVEITLSDNVVKIQSEQSVFSLLAMSGEFPKIKPMTGNVSYSIGAKELKELCRKTSFACAADDTRPVFTGVLLETDAGSAHMVATNVHRLAYAEAPTLGADAKWTSIVPKRMIDELGRVLPDEGSVHVACSDNEVSFAFGESLFTTRVISGSFPDFRRVFPKGATKKATIDVSAFSSALGRVALIAKSSEYNTVNFEFGNGMLKMTSTNPIVGKAVESVAIAYEGEPLEINFNASYVMDVLKVIDGEKVVVEMAEPLKPATFHNEKDNGFLYVATPVRSKK